MKAEFVRVPKEIIQNKRDILNGAIVNREGVKKQMVAKRFQDQERTFNKRIVAREVTVVPYALALEGWGMNDNSGSREDEGAKPIPLPNAAKKNRKSGE